jgi:cellulose synthase/poly-beta-1,6-N-acetylglucosamine synthase-like glycosyltransferase
MTILTIVLSLLIAVFLVAQLRGIVMTLLSLVLPRRPRPEAHAELPTVLIQLPVYREENVLEQLLGAVLALDYPADRLRIQVIDDSDAAAAAEAQAIVARHQNGPFAVEYLSRGDRTGYKAGAMNHGARATTSELIAVFDADFIPSPEFLRATVPYFEDSRIAAVQTRWTYRNGADSPLTMLQAAVFETVFCCEVDVRARLELPAFFMGTSGIWRRAAIDDIGGWREVPFTAEDLDLSYRAVNEGWFIAYDHRALSSCEASESFLAFKNQQRRWSRGIFQAFLDNWRGALHLRNGISGIALDASVMALQLSMPILTVLLALSMIPPIINEERTSGWLILETVLSATLLLLPTAVQLILAQRQLHADWRSRAAKLLRGSALASGLSLAVIAGLWDVMTRSRGEFVRTPKQRGIGLLNGTHRQWLRAGSVMATFELLFGLWGVAGLVTALTHGYPEAIVPAVALASGGAGAFAASFRELRNASAARTRTSAAA